MTRQIATYHPALPGLVPDDDARALAQSFHVVVEGSTLLIDRLPTVSEREQLANRLARIEQALVAVQPEERTDAQQAIADLLMAYGIVRADPNSAQTVATYVYHLQNLPLFAIKRACEDVKNGRVFDVDRNGNRRPIDATYPPSTIRLRAVADKHANELYAESLAFRRVLTARKLLANPISAEERKIVGEGLAALGAEIRAREAERDLDAKAARMKFDQEVRARTESRMVAEYDAAGVEPVRIAGILLSLELAVKLGHVRPKQGQTSS